MGAVESLHTLHGQGFEIANEGGRLVVSPASRLTDEIRALIRQHKAEWLALLSAHAEPPPLTADQRDGIDEAIAERAAIMEYDGGLPHRQAEDQATRAMRVYRYRVADRPLEWLTLIAPGCDLEEARATLIWRFGADRVLEIQPLAEATTTDD